MSLKTWWQKITREEYELIITVPGDVTIHADGSRTEKKTQQFYQAKKIIKAIPKHFVFIDLNGKRNEIKFLQPVDFHIVKVW
jgi:nicotinamide riboside kinase